MTFSTFDTHSDSLIEILTAQCADLEHLLALAQRETQAVEASDFDEVLRVVDARAQLGGRLEVYHRQITELREYMDDGAEEILENDAARRARRLVVEIQAQDGKLLPLLVAKRDEAGTELSRLNHARSSTSAYLRSANARAIACDARV